jgi:hypothetical protein
VPRSRHMAAFVSRAWLNQAGCYVLYRYVEFEAKRLCGVVKNKIAPTWQEAEFDIEWGQGISRDGDVLCAAIEAGVVSQSGGYFWYNDEMIGHGRESATQFLSEHPELFAELRAQVLGAQPEEQEGEA